MNTRTWIAVISSCIVWFVYMEFFAPPAPTIQKKEEQKQEDITTIGNSAPTTNTTTNTASTQAPTQTAANGSKTLLPAGFVPNPQTEVGTKDLDIFFSKEGGKIARVFTLSHTQSLEPGSPNMTILNPEENPWSLGTAFSATELAALSTGSYAMKKNEAGHVAYENTVPGALSISKQYTVGAGHILDWSIKLKRTNTQRKDWGYLYIPVGRIKAEHVSDNPLKAWEVVSYQDESVTRVTADKLSEATWKQGNTGWLAFGNRYFVLAVAPSGGINPDVGTFGDAAWSGGVLRYPLVFGEGDEIALNLKVFAGPKDYDLLRQIKGLGSVIDYGMFSFLAFPLLELLRFFYRFVGNYGLAIILLTLLVRVLFYPLSLKGYKSMKEMQKLQPQIQALKEKYKDDTAKFGQEQMALFKAHKVNPAGGCLPMLVQLPVFIALYAVLNSSVELFHAPFFGWITDLSAKDPYYIFPVLMGISMFVQQKMTPAAGMDPAQQKILLLMPIVFSFIMLNLPSGLTVYIFLSTLLGILQQTMINRSSNGVEKPSSPTPRPAS